MGKQYVQQLLPYTIHIQTDQESQEQIKICQEIKRPQNWSPCFCPQVLSTQNSQSGSFQKCNQMTLLLCSKPSNRLLLSQGKSSSLKKDLESPGPWECTALGQGTPVYSLWLASSHVLGGPPPPPRHVLAPTRSISPALPPAALPRWLHSGLTGQLAIPGTPSYFLHSLFPLPEVPYPGVGFLE